MSLTMKHEAQNLKHYISDSRQRQPYFFHQDASGREVPNQDQRFLNKKGEKKGAKKRSFSFNNYTKMFHVSCFRFHETIFSHGNSSLPKCPYAAVLKYIGRIRSNLSIISFTH